MHGLLVMRRMRLFSLVVATGSLLTASTVHAQSASAPDSKRAAAFDRLDRTARMLTAAVSCAIASGQARADGLFGPIDSVGRRGQCLRTGERTFGVFFTADSAFTKALNVRVVDLRTRTRYSGAVDTAAILAEARASRDGVTKGYSAYQREKRPFAPLSIRTDGDSIEVWLLPAGVLMGTAPSVVGGERGYVYSPDGRTLAREIDAFEQFRPLAIPDSGQIDIISEQDDLPLVSELIATNRLHDHGRQVQILTKAYSAHLVGAGPDALWVQLRRR